MSFSKKSIAIYKSLTGLIILSATMIFLYLGTEDNYNYNDILSINIILVIIILLIVGSILLPSYFGYLLKEANKYKKLY